jgi:hypothetical protein
MDALVQETHQLFAEKETEATWEAFNAQLRKWEQLLTSTTTTTASTAGAAAGPKAKIVTALGLFNGIGPHVVASMASERTILSATACDVVRAAAASLGGDFEQLADVFCPALLRLCQRSNKVFIRRAEDTMLAVLETARPTKVVPFLVEALSKANRSRQSKGSAAKFMLRLLQVFSNNNGADNATQQPSPLDAYADSISVALSEVRPLSLDGRPGWRC